MLDESFEGFRLSRNESSRERGFAWLVHAMIVARAVSAAVSRG
jgi:hypothetical protein